MAVDVTAAIAASTVGSLWSAPCEVLKCTFQSGMYTRLPGAVRAIVADCGVMGFYQGYSSQLLRDLSGQALLIASYE
eukprot:CAMPEP_0172213364 /NCGR_PEP_ID=MMETSP1050-20130122/37550_1 /TAXON_ID=233186 /ORGANISM="Cryptomonas curvata, Strain CCAP979/52" /LENGTH=76 /DNA_ID=CAMNT_0012894185 /DNA_START=12 /DNA_END=239 /DNA_ORIENTATION=+